MSTGADPAVVDALAEAARQEAPYAPAVSAELLADAEPFLAPDDERRERLLLDRAVALYLSGQGRAAADLAARRLPQVTDPRVAGGLVTSVSARWSTAPTPPGPSARSTRHWPRPGSRRPWRPRSPSCGPGYC